jgi:hypothetical protein
MIDLKGLSQNELRKYLEKCSVDILRTAGICISSQTLPKENNEFISLIVGTSLESKEDLIEVLLKVNNFYNKRLEG